MFPGGQPDMSQLLKQAQQMQQQLVAAQEQLARTEVTGSAGGELVVATMTGSGELTGLTIAPAAVDPDDLETLQDLIIAAVRDAKRGVDELAAETMGPLAGGAGGLGVPGLSPALAAQGRRPDPTHKELEEHRVRACRRGPDRGAGSVARGQAQER